MSRHSGPYDLQALFTARLNNSFAYSLEQAAEDERPGSQFRLVPDGGRTEGKTLLSSSLRSNDISATIECNNLQAWRSVGFVLFALSLQQTSESPETEYLVCMLRILQEVFFAVHVSKTFISVENAQCLPRREGVYGNVFQYRR